MYDLIVAHDDLDLLLYIVGKVGVQKSMVRTLIQHRSPYLYNGLIKRYYTTNPELSRIVYDLLDFSWFHETKTLLGALNRDQQIDVLERCLRAYIHGEASLNRYLIHVLHLPNTKAEDLLFDVVERYYDLCSIRQYTKFQTLFRLLRDMGMLKLADRLSSALTP